MSPNIKNFMLALLATLLAGCATPQTRPAVDGPQVPLNDVPAEAAPEAPMLQRVAPSAVAADSSGLPLTPMAAAASASAPRVERGTGKFINEAVASRGPGPAQEGDVVFNFENQPIQAVIKAILGDLLEENYVIAPGVQGNVTFSTSKPINAAQARAVLETLLSWNNLALVYREGRYTVLPVGQAIPGNLRPRMGPLANARGYEVRVAPLKFIAPTEMEKLLAPYVKQGAIVRADNARAMMVLAGTPSELANYLDTIDTFDVDWLAGMSIGVFTLERVEAKTVVPELEKVFGEGGATPLAGMFRFMPIERMNAVLVITPQPKYLDEAERWLKRLDRGGSEAGAQLYVYYVKNVKAKDIATNLTEIFTGRSSSGGGSRESSVGAVVPGVESVEIRSLNSGDKSAAGSAPPPLAPPQPASFSGGGNGIAIVESDTIRISAIEESNALLIRATPPQYDSIEAAIKRLDIEPLQVHIEAQIVQVDLTKNLSFGVRWFFENSTSETTAGGISDFRRRVRRFSQADESTNRAWNSFAGSASSSGLAWTFLNTSAEAILNTLQNETNVSVLSAPSLVVLNNKEASINVGTQIPVVSSFINQGTSFVNQGTGTGTGTGTSNGAFGQSYVQFRDTGLILNVTPRVNPGGLVYLEIKQEQSTPGTTADPTGNVPVDRRIVETEIAVQSGETVLLAGLIRDSNNTGQAGVPGLMKVPLLGRLFGNSNREGSRQELLVLIKPTVISTSDEARSLTEEYKTRFQGIRPMLEKAAEKH